MLNFLGEHQEAFKLEEALIKVLEQGKYLTPDLGGTSTTKEMARAVREIFQK
jgi:methanogen homoisocitrate dehydrogenase